MDSLHASTPLLETIPFDDTNERPSDRRDGFLYRSVLGFTPTDGHTRG